MAEGRSLDLLLRERRSSSVLLATTIGTAEQSVDLDGVVRLVGEPGSLEVAEAGLTMGITAEDAAELYAEQVEGSLHFFDSAGSRLGPRVDSYSVMPSIDGRYEIHSGVVVEDAGEADMFVVSDVVPLAIAAGIGAACLIIYASQVALVVTTIKAYERQGLVAKIKVRAGVMASLTCRFDVEIEAQDPRGKVVDSKTVRLGRP